MTQRQKLHADAIGADLKEAGSAIEEAVAVATATKGSPKEAKRKAAIRLMRTTRILNAALTSARLLARELEEDAKESPLLAPTQKESPFA